MAKEVEEVQPWQTVAPVEFSPRMSDRTEQQSLLVLSRQGAGYAIAGGQLSHAIQSRATHILMDFGAQACSMRYQIDGAWEPLPPLDRESGDAMLYAIKQLSQLNPADRRSAQTGVLDLKLVKEKFALTIQAQGIPTGERVLVRLEPEKVPFERLGDLGMRDKMIEQLRDELNREGALLVITAPKGEGLTTTWNVAMNAADRLVRDFQSFEQDGGAEPEIININPNYFGGETGLTMHEIVRKVVLKEPDVLMFPEMPEADALETCLDQVEKLQKQVMIRAVAPSAIEGFVSLLGKFPEQSKAMMTQCTAVLGQRLIRRLCDNCKVGFEPPPQLLAQLGIPAGRVAQLYQPFIPPPVEQQVDENGNPAPVVPCHVCQGRGYYGRVAIFELLRPGDNLRSALGKTRDIAQLSQIAKQEGHRPIQSEGILAVARGLTSLDELKRAFAKRK